VAPCVVVEAAVVGHVADEVSLYDIWTCISAREQDSNY
jgi:hypothetical protein